MIPKILHNIWIQGYDQLPEEVKKNNLLVKKANPVWEFMIWDHTAILKLLKKYPIFLSMYKNLNKYIVFNESNSSKKMKKEFIKTKGILAKYIILKEYGGVYYDVNLTCKFHFDELFSNDVVKDKKNSIYLVKNNNIYSDYLYYLYPFFKENEIDPQFMAFSKNHPIWETVFSKLKTLRSEKQMDHLLDYIFVYDNTYPVIYFEKKGECFEKKDGGPFSLQLPFLHYYYKQIYLLIVVCLSVYIIHHITVFNSHIFSFPSAVPIPSGVTSQPIKSMEKEKKKLKSKK